MVATSNELAVVLVSEQKTAHLRREGAQPTIFGLPDERLTIHHDSGTGAMPYVGGTLLAVRKVMTTTGLVCGLDRLLFS